MKLTLMAAIAAIATISARAGDRIPIIPTEVHDPRVIAAMKAAWRESGCGQLGIEAAFRLDGSPSNYRIIAIERTFEQGHQTVTIVSGVTFALFHVHPKTASPEPSSVDESVGQKYALRIYSIHARGLYAYDPNTKKTVKVRDGVEWMGPN